MAGQPVMPAPPPADLVLEYRAALLARLEQQPVDFVDAIAAIPAEDWHTRRGSDGRTAHLAAAHVRDLETLVYLPYVRRILQEERPELAVQTHHNWSAAGYDPDEPMTNILEAWSQARTEMVAWLRPLPPAAWSRMGFHPPTGQRTLMWWVERAYLHAVWHLAAVQPTE